MDGVQNIFSKPHSENKTLKILRHYSKPKTSQLVINP